MTALSTDLRQRVVAYYEAHKATGATYASTARHFAIGHATVNRWLRLKRETGDVVARPRRAVKRSPLDLDWLREHVVTDPDATLKRRALEHQQAFGGRVPSVPAIWDALRRLGFTHKKRRSTLRSGNWSMSQR